MTDQNDVQKFTLVLSSGHDSRPREVNSRKDGKTKFSFSNFSESFDEHIDKSIRGYSDLRNDVVSISQYFVEDKTTIIDLGCSQGSLIAKIKGVNEHAPDSSYLGVEINESFCKHWKPQKNLDYLVEDITTMNMPPNLSLAMSLFTMQFIPERKRVELIDKIFYNLNCGGAFIFSEKVLCESSKLQNMFDFIYYDYKKRHFSEKEILDKENQLRPLMKLNTERELIGLVQNAGFKSVQCFWRNYNFVAFVAIKPVI